MREIRVESRTHLWFAKFFNGRGLVKCIWISQALSFHYFGVLTQGLLIAKTTSVL